MGDGGHDSDKVIARRYRLDDRVGRGGLGEIWRATDLQRKRTVAIKRLLPLPGIQIPVKQRMRLQREAMALEHISHPHVVRCLDFGFDDELPYLVLEWLEGENLAQRQERGRIEIYEMLEIARQALAGLKGCHSAGVVHRDIKPSNLFLVHPEDGIHLKVLDLGLAWLNAQLTRLTSTGAVVGTLHYLAPEQIQGLKSVDHRADIYALGVVLYEMATGRLPFEAEDPMAVIFKIASERPPSPRELQPDLPAWLAQAILRAMSRSPEDRYPTAEAMAAALTGESMPAVDPTVEATVADTLANRRDEIPREYSAETPPADLLPEQGFVVVDPVRPQMELPQRLQRGGPIAGGGMGQILTALDTNLLRVVALKRLHLGANASSRENGRLIAEAQILAQLDHPAIVPVYELAMDEGGELFYTMKLIRGQNLAKTLAARDPGTRTAAELFALLQVLIKVCDAVTFAHSRGVIHRDLKPANIMLGDYGEVHLMDWGIALPKQRGVHEERPAPGDRGEGYEVAPEAGLVVGTPGFMAPEQAGGDVEAVDERADIFSLGAILYKILTGVPPFRGASVFESLYKLAHIDLVPPQDHVGHDLPPALCQIAVRALQKNPDQRYQTVEEFKKDVESFMQSGFQLPSRVYSPGELIIREGETGDEAYIITDGTCQVFKGTQSERTVLRQMDPGDVFGETAILADRRRTASVEALDQVTVLVVSRGQLLEEMGTGFFLGRFLKALAERFYDRDERTIQLEQHADRSELTILILQQLNFSGWTANGNGRESTWSDLRDKLTKHLRCSPEQVTARVAKLELFFLDEERDIVSLKR